MSVHELGVASGAVFVVCSIACTSEQATDPREGTIKQVYPSRSAQRVIDLPITSCEEAIAVAEQFLSKLFGKENVLGERAYNCEKVGTTWRISGTIPDDPDSVLFFGGIFSIGLNELDGQVVEMSHSQSTPGP
jgi:hypothetical protein